MGGGLRTPGAPALLAVLAAVAAVYVGAGLGGPFVLDDHDAIVTNPTLASFGAALTPPEDTSVAGRPVVNLTFALSHALHGLEPMGWRVANLLLHLACVALLCVLVAELLATDRVPARIREGGPGIALAAGLLWGLHPLASETVLYATQRTELCFQLAALGTLVALVRAARGPASAGWSLVAVASCWLGTGCKEAMVVVPVLALLLDRAFLAQGFADALRRRRGLHGGLFASWIAVGALVAAQPRGLSVGFDHGYGATDWLAAQVPMVATYLRLAVLPVGLVLDYGPLADAPRVGPGLAVGLAAGVILGGAWVVLRHPRAGFAVAWVLGLLAPTSSFVPIVTEVGAERRMVLALAGPLVLALAAGARLVPRRTLRRGAVLALALLLGGLTWTRAREYRDAVSLWSTVAERRPGNSRGRFHHGYALVMAGDRDGAEAEFRAALDLDPDLGLAHTNLGILLASAGRLPEGLPHLERGARIDADDPTAHLNLGIAQRQAGREADARASLGEALRLAEVQGDAVLAARARSLLGG